MRKFPSLFVLLFVITGIVTSDLSKIDSSWFLLAGFILCVAAFLSIYRNRSGLAAVLFAAALGSISGFHFSHQYHHPGPRHLTRVVNERKLYHIFARVADWPDLKPNRTEIKLAVDSLVSDISQTVEGGILLKITDTSTALQKGDNIEFYGRIYSLPDGGETDGFNYRRYLALKDVFGIVYLPTLLDVRIDRRSHFSPLDQIDHLRAAIRSALYTDLSPQSAALASGFLIGETRDIPASIYTMFRDSGTLHLLAVSGSNVALMLIFIAFLMKPLGLSRRMRAALLVLLILVFTLLSYGEPSVVRAALMAALVIFAGLVNRRHDLNNIIALTALIVLLIDPAQLYDVGFQLSFATAWGLIALTPRVTELFGEYHQRWWYKWAVFPLVISLIAQVCSTPLIAYYFGRVPVISPLANLIIVPLVSVAVIATLVLLVVHATWPLLGLFAGSFVDLLLRSVVSALGFFGGEKVPIIQSTHTSPKFLEVTIVLLAYALVLLFVWSIRHRWARRAALLTAMIALNGLLTYAIISGRNTVQPGLLISAVPGGVTALVVNPGSDKGDLIVAGLTQKEYAIDEKIIVPQLQQLGITKLRYLIVVSSSYLAIDDLLRVAGRFRADSVFVDHSLEPSLQDLMNAGVLSDTTRPLIWFSGRLKAVDRPGFYLSDLGCVIAHRRGLYVIADHVQTTHAKMSLPFDRNALVVGSRWFPRAEDWINLRRAGYNSIVCSKVELLRSPSSDRSESAPDMIRPEYLYDLSERGAIKLPL